MVRSLALRHRRTAGEVDPKTAVRRWPRSRRREIRRRACSPLSRTTPAA